jgi:1,4-dihydroxy-2-naphthoate octaprenyltransferase
MVAPALAMSPGRVWWSAVRPATLAASVAPVLAATAVALHEGEVNAWAGLAALVVALSVQLGVNFANDYSDFKRGADTAARVGPVRASASGVVRPEHVRLAALAAFAVAGLVGLVLSVIVDWRLLFVGGACLLAGWLYTGGPRPYGYLGLGELFVFIFFGLVATCGTVYVETLRVSPLAILIGCGVGFLATAILVLNNLRDIDTDRAAHKRTLATLIGRQPTRYLLLVLAFGAFTVPIVIFVAGLAPVTILASLLAIVIVVPVIRTAISSTAAPALIGGLKQMAAAELIYALLLMVGLVLR